MAQTTVVSTVKGFAEQSMTQQTVAFSVDATGVYSIGFEALNRVQLNIKDIEITERYPVELSADAISGAEVPMVGEKAEYTISVTNHGYREQTGFGVQLVDAEDNVVAETEADAIEPFTTKNYTVEWTPSKTGETKIRARVMIEGDADITNNETQPMDVTVLEGGRWVDVVKEGMAPASVAPFYMNQPYSLEQSIYDADSIDCQKANIKGLMFYYKYMTDQQVDDIPVKIWLANTSKLNFTDKSVLPESDFTLVFDGKISLPVDKTSTIVLFDKPFEYTGGNLAMMTRNNNGARISGVYFMSQSNINDRERHTWYCFGAEQPEFPASATRVVKDLASVSLFVDGKGGETGITGITASDGGIQVKVNGHDLYISGDYERLCVYNVGGQKVAEASHAATVALPGCRPGFYVLEFTAGSTRTVRRVVLN